MAKLGLNPWRAACLTALLWLPASGSGTYQPRLAPPAPDWQAAAARYELGKAIFQGRLNPAAGSPGADVERLKRVRQILPANAHSQARLAEGGYTEEQLSALEYFLEIRFKVRP